MNFATIQLGSDDINMFRELMNCFACEFDDPETYLGNQPTDQYLAELLSNDSLIVLVAVDAGKVIGGLAAYVLRKFEQPRSELYIYDLAVTEAYRRNGIATALIQSLKPIAIKKQAWVIYVQADQGDEAAIGLYSKIGVQEEVLHFDIAPTGSETDPL